MNKLVFAFLGIALLTSACGKKEEEAPKAAPSGAAAAATAPAAKAASPGAAAANDPVVCCKFGGVKGSSTKKLCEDGKGSVVPDAECPTLKK